MSPVVSSRVVSGVRIVGGEVAQPGAWPWAALLGRPGISGGLTVVCGASLISPDTLLTAAHCFEGSARDPGTVRLGEHDINSVEDGRHVDVSIQAIVKHPSWDPQSLENDIAIVKMSSNVTLTEVG